MSSNEGDIILDPFNGTGTTTIAAKKLGRHYIGFELDTEYVTITEEKLKKQEASSKIGDCWVSFFLDNIVTLRDKDWASIKEFYLIPEKIQDIDHSSIILKSRMKRIHKKIHTNPYQLQIV